MAEFPEQSPVSRIWSELKRRRVIRVIVLYAVAGWIVIEVASTVLPNLNLPEWTVTLVTALVVFGFIIAIMLAWAFDIGSGGVRIFGNRVSFPASDIKSKPDQKWPGFLYAWHSRHLRRDDKRLLPTQSCRSRRATSSSRSTTKG